MRGTRAGGGPRGVIGGRRSRSAGVVVCAAIAGALLPACGPSLYTFQILPASSAVHSAEQSGAPEHAPYEYWTAREYLEKAAEEANEGNYQDAIRFAERAREMGQAAQQRTADRMQEERAAATAPRPASGAEGDESPEGRP